MLGAEVVDGATDGRRQPSPSGAGAVNSSVKCSMGSDSNSRNFLAALLVVACALPPPPACRLFIEVSWCLVSLPYIRIAVVYFVYDWGVLASRGCGPCSHRSVYIP